MDIFNKKYRPEPQKLGDTEPLMKKMKVFSTTPIPTAHLLMKNGPNDGTKNNFKSVLQERFPKMTPEDGPLR
jgi:hypothetical protein